MEELQEVITCAEFHPVQCNEFIYSTTKGIIRVCDLRASAICDRNAKGI
jgi:serine/threonine-protein phosphatase 2A regulatory subunit B